MRKETINTFSDGMSLDLNPLGTPAKTLTNCLNGTLVTYNGNELTLQNDMGNVEVGTAALPKGYVPVGMKEYGGIIYVASYNPETKKGQLGCFPSPLQIYISEAALTVFEFNIQDLFIKFFNEYPVIQSNEYKEEIFKDSVTLEARIFSSGDMFLIKTNEPYSDNVREAINKGIITLKLFIIPINGEEPIDITNQLHTYPDNWQVPLWIYLNTDNISFETLLANHRGLLLTYKGPLGTLEIVVEFNTFELFNLYRLFYKSGDLFEVKFIGEATADGIDNYSLMPFGLFGNINNYNHNLSNIEEIGKQIDAVRLLAATDNKKIPNNGTLYYDIMPGSPYGILKLDNSFLKTGELTSQGIFNAHDRITNWDFEINTDSAIIQWTYTLFEDDPKIDHMRFVFIPLDKVLEQGGKTKDLIDQLYISGNSTTEPDNPNIYTIKKSYYSGDFEDKIILDDEGLLHNYIYLCRLDVIYKEGVNLRAENGHDYKLLYTGTFFNDKNVSDFNNSNRPEVTANIDLDVQLSYTVKSFNYTTFLEDENGNIFPSEPKEIVTANDIMFLANNDKYYKKIVGIILNIECEVTSTLSIKDEDIVQYGDEDLPFRPTFAGRIATEQTLDACAVDGKITCTIKSETNPSYEGDGDELVQEELKKYIVEEEIDDLNKGTYKPLDGATITYTKQGTTYLNTSTIKIHRGIVSRMGQEDFYSVLLESLFPVYEPEDSLYNERMFGFNIDEDGNLSNIIEGDDFMSMSLYLAKRRNIDASTDTFEKYIKDEKLYNKKTALSKYDIENLTPYNYGATLSDGSSIINSGSLGMSRSEAIQKLNNCPINIIASNRYERLWDKSYYDGDVDTRITDLLCLPHSEIFEKIETSLKLKFEDGSAHEPDWKNITLGYAIGGILGAVIAGILDLFDDGDFRPKYISETAKLVREVVIEGKKDKDLKGNNNKLFHTTHGMNRAMYISWKSLYGNLLMNIATPLGVEYDTTESELFTVSPVKNENGKVEKLQFNRERNKIGEKYKINETHLRADHMLLCLLSQILITKKKTSNLLLNAPDISQLYSTTAFKNKGLLSINNLSNPVLVLEEKNVEEILTYILSNNILNAEDNFIPKFKVNSYSNGYIDCGGKISISSDRFGMINLDNLFYAEGIPEFSTVTDEERVNIYPGLIEKIYGTYLCILKKNKLGLYEKNTDLIVNGKFYKVFLPTIISESNKESSKYYCKNYDTYKLILEGFAYNDILFPRTKIEQMLGKEIHQLNSQEDLESPYFNLLYYNSINLKFHQGYSLHCSNETDGDYYREEDFCHGFGHITLFGDLSRFIDSKVFLKNSAYGLSKAAWEVDRGWSADYCYARNIYEYANIDKDHYSAECPPELFILAPEDWVNVNTYAVDTLSVGAYDDPTIYSPVPEEEE